MESSRSTKSNKSTMKCQKKKMPNKDAKLGKLVLIIFWEGNPCEIKYEKHCWAHVTLMAKECQKWNKMRHWRLFVKNFLEKYSAITVDWNEKYWDITV